MIKKETTPQSDTQGPLWEVFTQGRKGKPFQHAGSLHAPDAEQALQNARDVYTRRKEAISLWVVPTDQITASSPEEEGPFFDPAHNKPYRYAKFYSVPHAVKKRS